MSLSVLKNADSKIKMLIFGYTREVQSELELNIPIMIQYIFMAHYWIKEQFAIHGRDIALDKTNKNAHVKKQLQSPSLVRDQFQTVYGNNVINAKDTAIIKYEWSFRYINTNTFAIYIGIDSSNDTTTEDDFSDPGCNKHKFYALGSSGKLYSYDEEIGRNFYHGNISYYYNRGDIIVMTLEIKDNYGELIIRNNSDGTIIGEHINLENDKYNMAVAMVTNGKVEIELIGFTVYQK
eukprot:471609_1